MPDASDAVAGWSDDRLLAAAPGTAEDTAALDVIVRRHRCALERRCAMLTSDWDRAADLAQDTWTRMLRARATLRGEGSFGAYLATIALNLWRDRRKAELHASELSEQRLVSLDASAVADGEDLTIAEVVASGVSSERTILLRLDLDYALARLPARLRAIVVARHVRGESAAEIGRRCGRTEQTITAWLREATRQMRQDLAEWQTAA